jgi:hypothetical protein
LVDVLDLQEQSDCGDPKERTDLLNYHGERERIMEIDLIAVPHY